MASKKNQSSRRQFLKTTGGVAFLIGAGGLLPQLISCKNPKVAETELTRHPLTAWVQLSEDGRLCIFNPAAEMGQGSMTALPVLFAEEMDANWDKVDVAFAPLEPETYGAQGFGNNKMMFTVGSRTTRSYFPVMRQAGAQARYVLLHSMAQQWEVPLSELSTRPGFVLHSKSGQVIAYGDILPFLQLPASIPEFPLEQLKAPKDFRLIGKDIPRYDTPGKVDGSARFAIDVQLPNMLYGVIERGKLHGAKPSLQNEASIRAMEGILEVVKLDYGIGIIARTIQHALTAKKQLSIQWSKAKASGFNSEDAYKAYAQLKKGERGSKIIRSEGDFKRAKRKAKKVYEADYKNDYVYHAQMEPLNAVVAIAEDGQSAEAWVGSQQGFQPKLGLPKLLNIPPENVKINLCYLGGGLGRRSATDFLTEAALLAKAVVPQPVKLIWTREDDLQYGMYRPMSLQRMSACVDQEGYLTGFSHVVVGDGANLLTSGIKNEFYTIPNQHAEVKIVKHGVRIKHWRSVGHAPNKFAIECMIDEVALGQEQDPLEFRRALMRQSPKALATLDKVAEMAEWGKELPAGRGRGVAFLERSGALSSAICEISVNEETGEIRVHHFWSATDAGIIVQPRNVEAQIEGGIIMGISSVLKEQISIKNGEVEQSNFHDYQLLRMKDIPQTIETVLMESEEIPQGVGESGTPMVAAAVANAFAALTGKRLRHLPFTPERVLAVLKS